MLTAAGPYFEEGDEVVWIDADLVRALEKGSWLDYGMFIQNVMLAARARGLDTCPQAAFLDFHKIISECIGIPDNEMVVCGMSLGWADPDAVINTLYTDRDPVEGFARFSGF
jgi:nitroreductase